MDAGAFEVGRRRLSAMILSRGPVRIRDLSSGHTIMGNFDNIRIVLVNTTHPGNIGAAARALKNMGLSRLYLVAPKDYPAERAVWRETSIIVLFTTRLHVSLRIRFARG